LAKGIEQQSGKDGKMKKVFERPKSMKNAIFHYCAGCGHSIAHRLIAEVIDEMEIRDIAIGILPAGCAVLAYNYFDVDMIEAQHGRGPAMATGMKRVLPDRVVFCYQGDGDLAAIGIAESFHAANRGENITIIFINNAVYGMTGGQMAPTSLLAQKTTTSTAGRESVLDGHPIRISEIFSQLPGTTYIERCTVNSPASILKTKKSIRKAFQCQIDGRGFSLVEILSPCPTNWKMTPVESCRWIDEVMSKEFPLGVLKDLPEAKRRKEEVKP
jgi:2-oxoglutarate/2-oxoacid ferredoxin oxidoreductase subunit beta